MDTTNEPVAWIVKTFDADKGKTVEAIWDFKPMNTIGCTPLYTHPSEHDLGIAEAIGFDKGYKAATAKTLTDEEIDDIASMCSVNENNQINDREFARAIVKKASEK